MNKHLSREELRKLPVEDRLQLLEDVWASLCETPEKVDIPEWHRRELDRRMADQKALEEGASAWPDVRDKILSLRSKE